MAQDLIVSFFVYFLLFIYENPSAAPVRENELELPECGNCLEKNSKREPNGFLTRGTNSKYVKNLSDYYNAYTQTRNYNYLFLKGWGAGGMPFNVLYTPNIHQKKILKSVQQQKKPERVVKGMPEIYDLVLEDPKPPQKNSERTRKKHLIPRKYYSLIPQLFVSYGW